MRPQIKFERLDNGWIATHWTDESAIPIATEICPTVELCREALEDFLNATRNGWELKILQTVKPGEGDDDDES